MTADSEQDGWVELSDAIKALRRELTKAWCDGERQRIRFRAEPVELTVQVGVTRTGKGSAGVKWHILALGGERSRETVMTQELKLRLAPVLYDEHGRQLPDEDQLISGRDGGAGNSAAPGDEADEPRHEPE